MGIFSKLFKPKYTKWQTYLESRPVQRNDVTNGTKIDRAYSQLNANIYYQQYNDSVNLIGTTKNPEVFFDRYDYAVTRIIGLIYMQKYVKIEGSDLSEAAEKLIDSKQELVKQLIERRATALNLKLLQLKTVKSKINNIQKFEDEFISYHCEMSQENIDYINRIADYYKQNCK